jgi:dienelactone hydrolase
VSAVAAQDSLALPDLSGEFAVGMTHYDLVDEARDETYTSDPDDKREILLTIYYPAEPASDAQPAPYLSEAMTEEVVVQAGVPYFLLNFDTHAYPNPPAAEGSFPVLIFSPGFGNLTAYYTSLLEDVASHGYIVAAIWHPYSTSLVELDGGRIIPAGDPTVQLDDTHIEETFSVWEGDALFALDTLETLNESDAILADHLDLDHIGAFGHSFGGATAAEIALEDERVDAAINMDGTLHGDSAREGLSKPFMVMLSEQVIPTDEELRAAGVTHEQYEYMISKFEEDMLAALENAQPGYRFELVGSAHNTYSTDMLAIADQYSMLINSGLVGTIDPAHAFDLIRSYVVAFFDDQLKGSGTPITALPNDEAVMLETFNGG